LYEPLEVVHDLREPVQGELPAQILAVRAGQRAEVRPSAGMSAMVPDWTSNRAPRRW